MQLLETVYVRGKRVGQRITLVAPRETIEQYLNDITAVAPEKVERDSEKTTIHNSVTQSRVEYRIQPYEPQSGPWPC